MTVDGVEDGSFVRAMQADVEANAWLKAFCFERLSMLPGYGDRTYTTEKAVFRGKTFFPCVQQLYLISHSPRHEGIVQNYASEAGYNVLKLKYYYDTYDGRFLPLPFVRSFVAQSADVADASVDNVLKSLARLNMIRMKSCDMDRSAKAIQFERDLSDCIGQWMRIKARGWMNE